MRRQRRVVLVVVLGLAAGTLAGCTTARNDLGTRVSLCFRFLPEAHAAAGPSSRFAGVRLLSGGALMAAITGERHNGSPPPPASLAAVSHQATCLVAFSGTFGLSSVSHGWAPTAGPYLDAIVVVRQSDSDLVATVLFRRLPRAIRFFETTAFVRCASETRCALADSLTYHAAKRERVSLSHPNDGSGLSNRGLTALVRATDV